MIPMIPQFPIVHPPLRSNIFRLFPLDLDGHCRVDSAEVHRNRLICNHCCSLMNLKGAQRLRRSGMKSPRFALSRLHHAINLSFDGV
jgi:hypothetical protein